MMKKIANFIICTIVCVQPLFSIIRVAPSNPARLPFIQKAPSFQGITKWYNSPALSLEELKGKVVLVNFWTLSCINCIQTFHFLQHIHKTYKDNQVVVIGIHTPEYSFEIDPYTVEKSIEKYEIRYPVGLDTYYKTWHAYNIRGWPTSLIIDQDSMIRKIHIGEGGYLTLENAILQLLGKETIKKEDTSLFTTDVHTPEIHLGYQRAQNYTSENKLILSKETSYNFQQNLPLNSVGLKGIWTVQKEKIIAGPGAEIVFNVFAKKVYLPLSGYSPKPIRIYLDKTSLPAEFKGKDVNDSGELVIQEDRLYEIIDMGKTPKRNTFTLFIPEGLSLYELSFL